MSSDNLDTMRGLAEENSKLFLQTANHTINLWPAAIFACLLLVGKWTVMDSCTLCIDKINSYSFLFVLVFWGNN